MDANSIASAAKLIADPARANMLLAMFDVDGLPASELARRANVSPQTASSHLSKLCDGGLLEVKKHGRHRYYKLSSPDVAEALQGLMAVAPQADAQKKENGQLEPLHFARTCYDHLAGKLDVALVDALLQQRWIRTKGQTFEVTPKGKKGFQSFDIDVDELQKKRRRFAWQCLNWTERRYHMSGALGAALTESLLTKKWILKDKGSQTIHLSNKGRKGLLDVFDIRLQ